MRLFVALDLNEAVRSQLGQLLREFRAVAPDIRWVKPEAVHLTLKFLGEQPEDRLPLLGEALAKVPVPGPLELGFRGLGCFPNERHPRVFWVGVEAPPELARLATEIDAAVGAVGIEREQRPFSPHLTLGRAREGRPVRLPAQIWEAHQADDFGRFTAHEFFLYQSRLAPGGAEYTKLRAFLLGK